MIMFYVTIEGANETTKKCSSIFDTYILIENLLLIVSYNIYRINLFLTKTDETIWKHSLSKRTPPLSTKPHISEQFFMTPLFVQI